MKIICVRGEGFTVKPDTALLRNNEPFYMPSFGGGVSYGTGVVVRVNRVVKAIEERFAHRCYDEAGVGVDFAVAGLGDGRAAFDRSFAVSPRFLPLDEVRAHVDTQAVDRSIAYVSRFVTLKIGDLLFIGAGAEPVAVGDRVTASLAGEVLLDFDVK